MPIFEFKCNSCQSKFQDLFPSAHLNVAEVVCTNCGEKNAEKLFSVFASDTKSASESMPASACGPHCACHPS